MPNWLLQPIWQVFVTNWRNSVTDLLLCVTMDHSVLYQGASKVIGVNTGKLIILCQRTNFFLGGGASLPFVYPEIGDANLKCAFIMNLNSD